MAPEQHLGAQADARSDQFSFCVSLYEAVYGERPFDVDSSTVPTTIAVGLAATRGEVRPPPRGARVPARVRRILVRGLDPDPAARWPSMEDLIGALVRARGRRLRVAAAAAAIVAAGVALALSTRSSPRGDGLVVSEIRALTLADGCEEMPALTPDGRTVVFGVAALTTRRLAGLRRWLRSRYNRHRPWLPDPPSSSRPA